MPHPYSVPILSGEQHRSASARQCAELLLHLDNVMEDIFSTILCRINDNAKKIEDLKERSSKAHQKVQALKGRTKATQVFSSARYPGRKVYCPYQHLLNADPKPTYKISSTYTYKPIPYNDGALSEKLEFFHVRDIEKHVKIDTSNSNMQEGLGRLPAHINSISSLVLYNTSHNPYKKYKAVDPLRFSSRSDVPKSDSISKIDIHEAPVSLLEGDRIGATKDEFQYIPDLSDLPELDLPLELPTLPGIAEDLLYNVDEGQPIAPSMVLPDLPLLKMTDEDELLSSTLSPPPIFLQSAPATNLNIAIKSNDNVETGPLIEKLHSSSSNDLPSNRNKEKIMIPPPPPPPPPPPLPPPILPPPTQISTQSSSISATVVIEEKSVPQPSAISLVENIPDTRSDLMKAIQAAGGVGKAKLRKVSHNEKVTKNESTKVAPPSNDLMFDLNAKLLQRRKGISGTMSKGNDQSTMQKMSFIIPPPPVIAETDSDAKVSEDDWD